MLGSDSRGAAEVPASRAAPRRRPARRRTAQRGHRSRADQLLALAGDRPGVTVAEAAERLGTSRQTIYNLTGRLQREGRLRKSGRGFHLVE